MKAKCASCIWFYTDEEDGECYCTINPPDWKGRYPRVAPGSKCKDYEAADETSSIYETKDERQHYVR